MKRRERNGNDSVDVDGESRVIGSGELLASWPAGQR